MCSCVRVCASFIVHNLVQSCCPCSNSGGVRFPLYFVFSFLLCIMAPKIWQIRKKCCFYTIQCLSKHNLYLKKKTEKSLLNCLLTYIIVKNSLRVKINFVQHHIHFDFVGKIIYVCLFATYTALKNIFFNKCLQIKILCHNAFVIIMSYHNNLID